MELKRVERQNKDLEHQILMLQNKLNSGKSRAAALLAEKRGVNRVEHPKVYPGVATGENAADNSTSFGSNADLDAQQQQQSTAPRWDADSFVEDLKRKKAERVYIFHVHNG